MNATRISEKDWVQWVHDFADIAIQEDTDLKFRMAMLKKAARERMADKMTEQQQELKQETRHAVGMLESIIIKIKQNAEIENPNWGHVGDINSLAEQLQDLEDRVYQCGEYART